MENGVELVLTDLPGLLLEASLLLSGAVLLGLFTRRIHVPPTAVLAVVGLLVSELGADLAITGLIVGEGFEILVLNMFLSILIFEAALMLSTREFMRNIVPISALATVALVISAFFVGVAIDLALSVSLTVALLFGVIVSATDPVAVVAVFREVGVSNRLLTLVEGESLLNDGIAIDATCRRLIELRMDDEVVEAHLTAAAVTARDDLARSHLTSAEELEVLTLRGLHIERETYQSLSDAGLLAPIATRTLMFEIDDEIEEASLGELRVEAARRAHLPWYALAHRRALGWLPPPLGEDLVEVAYIETSARRLAAQKAAAELEQFNSLPNIDREKVRLAKRTFTDWQESATRTLEKLDQQADIDQALLHRRQSQALSRITVR